MTFWIYAALPVWLFGISASLNWFFGWCTKQDKWWGFPLALAFGFPVLAIGVIGIVVILFAPAIK